MKPIKNIANVQEAGESRRLPAGGYICKYTKVEDNSDKNYLYMEFDIAEGEFIRFYDGSKITEETVNAARKKTHIESYKNSKESMIRDFVNELLANWNN